MMKFPSRLLAFWASLLLLPALGHGDHSSLSPLYRMVMRSTWDLHENRETPPPHVESRLLKSGREQLLVSFDDPSLGSFRLLVEGPRRFTRIDRAFPTVFVSAGFFDGTKPIELVRSSPRSKDLIIVAFEYAPNPEEAYKNPEALARTLLQIPGRLYLSLRWVESQHWFVPSQLHILGVSLGSLYLPSALLLLQEDGFKIPSLIIAFGGARTKEPLFQILRQHLGEQETRDVVRVLEPALSPYDPQLYLPSLQGRKLVIHGDRDNIFGAKTKMALDQSLQAPKVTCIVEGGHIGMKTPHEIKLTVGLLDQWIFKKDWSNLQQPQTNCAFVR